MGMSELRQWAQANLDVVSSATYGLTLRQAIAQGHDGAVHEIANAPLPAFQVGRGTLPWVVFNAEFTSPMYAQLSNQEKSWLDAQRVGAEGIDVSAAQVKPVLEGVGFPTERDGSPAEFHLGHPVSLAAVAQVVQRVQHRREERKACAADGRIELVFYEDGVELARALHPNGLRLADLGQVDVNLTEAEILAIGYVTI